MDYPLASIPYPAERVLMRRFGGFRGRSRIRLLREWAEAKMTQPSTRCEMRTFGEILIGDRSGMPSKPRALARALLPEEAEISGGIQTVRLRLVSPMWMIQN